MTRYLLAATLLALGSAGNTAAGDWFDLHQHGAGGYRFTAGPQLIPGNYSGRSAATEFSSYGGAYGMGYHGNLGYQSYAGTSYGYIGGGHDCCNGVWDGYGCEKRLAHCWKKFCKRGWGHGHFGFGGCRAGHGCGCDDDCHGCADACGAHGCCGKSRFGKLFGGFRKRLGWGGCSSDCHACDAGCGAAGGHFAPSEEHYYEEQAPAEPGTEPLDEPRVEEEEAPMPPMPKLETPSPKAQSKPKAKSKDNAAGLLRMLTEPLGLLPSGR